MHTFDGMVNIITALICFYLVYNYKVLCKVTQYILSEPLALLLLLLLYLDASLHNKMASHKSYTMDPFHKYSYDDSISSKDVNKKKLPPDK